MKYYLNFNITYLDYFIQNNLNLMISEILDSYNENTIFNIVTADNVQLYNGLNNTKNSTFNLFPKLDI